MYNFIDVNAKQINTPLPAEAMKINNKYLENEIPGYRTLWVKGRESLSPDIKTLDVTSRDGARLKYRRFPVRTITVGYQLIASSVEDFRLKYNKLGGILNVEDAELIFNDEKDKFFIGTPSKIGDVPEGRLSIEAEFEIMCLNPFKYSVREHVATPASETSDIVIDYKGAYKSYPQLIAKAKSDLGFVGFIKDTGKIIQIGDAQELDNVNKAKSETLISDRFTSVLSDWKLNSAKIISFTNADSNISTMQTGTVAIKNDRHSTPMIAASSYGSFNVFGGPSLTKEIPTDRTGHKGAKNWTFAVEHNFSVNSASQFGAVQFLVNGLVNGKKSTIAAASYSKNEYNNRGWGWLYVNDRNVKSYISIPDVTTENRITGHTGGRVEIKKFGPTVTFNFAGQTYEFSDADIASAEATEISIFFVSDKGYTPIDLNGVYSVKFISHSVENFEDVPNKFGGGDKILADCNSSEITVNGLSQQGLGALGNDWEDFYLEPGKNIVKCVCSSWATKPDFEIIYREVWL